MSFICKIKVFCPKLGFSGQTMFLIWFETAEVNFTNLHIKVNMIKMVSFLEALGSHAKVKVTIISQTTNSNTTSQKGKIK